MSVSGPTVFVADENNNSVTEVTVATGRLVRVIAGEGLDAPDGIAVEDGNVWVSNSAANSATEINAATGAAVVTETDSDGQYGFGSPSMVIATGGYVYVASPFGSSPMAVSYTHLDVYKRQICSCPPDMVTSSVAASMARRAVSDPSAPTTTMSNMNIPPRTR